MLHDDPTLFVLDEQVLLIIIIFIMMVFAIAAFRIHSNIERIMKHLNIPIHLPAEHEAEETIVDGQ